MGTDEAQRPAAGHALERLDPSDQTSPEAALHWARYEWACRFLPARRVLDCSCGLGYGSATLRARGAAQVVGVDVCAEAIASARQRYGRPGIEFVRADALTLDPAAIGRFDRIVSLEPIEHVAEPRRLLDVFAALLSADGVLVLSFPNDRLTGETNPFHLWTAEFADVRAWLTERFAYVADYALVQTVSAGVWRREIAERREDASPLYAAQVRLLDSLPIEKAAGFLFACSRSEPAVSTPILAAMLGGSTLLREMEAGNRWLESQWQAWKQQAETNERQIAKQRAYIQELEKVRAWLEEQRGRWETEAKRLAAELDRRSGGADAGKKSAT